MSNLDKVISCIDDTIYKFSSTQITNGLVNNTYLVQVLSPSNTQKLILQSINTNIFADPYLLIANYLSIHKFYSLNISDSSDFILPEMVKFQSNKDYILVLNSCYWRMFKYIDNSKTIKSVTSPHIAYQIGRKLSQFHDLFSDINSIDIKPTIPKFHDLSYHMRNLDKIKETNFKPVQADHSPLVKSCLSKLNFRRNYLNTHSNYLSSNHKHNNLIHGDPKCSNFLFDQNLNNCISIIDFDTISVGNKLIDISDCLRSLANPLGEDFSNINDIRFDNNLFSHFIDGYISTNIDNLCIFNDLIIWLKLITYELSIRFFVDYFENNRNFTVSILSQNLTRSLVQLSLLKDIEEKTDTLNKIVLDKK